MSEPTHHLPLPAHERWQPLRVGLVDLYQYDYEEWWFHDGRLLLRGNNGTGKSKVMALTLPFLLDGRLTPSRVEPDGDHGKRMEWNLLLGGRYNERQGYTWIEFGRLDGDGAPRYLTLGCGLKAVAGRGTPRSWFFTTRQRIGQSLFLMEEGRTLSRERLVEALGGEGRVHETGEGYRRAVDEQLFHLGSERYEALVSLLIQLRQPQLSKRPDPSGLSRTLTEALPPLDEGVLNEVAEAFRHLDTERDELAALQEASRAVGEFLDHYRNYARISTRRRGRLVRSAQSRYEECLTGLNHRRQQLAELNAEQGRREEEVDATGRGLVDARQEVRTLEASPEMRSAAELRRAEETAGQRRDHAGQMAALQHEAEGRLQRAEDSLARDDAALDASRAELAASLDRAHRQSEEAELGRSFAELVAPLALPDPGPEAPLATVDPSVEALLRRRTEGARHLQGLNQRVEQGRNAEEQSRERWQEAIDQGERLAEAVQEAAERVRREGGALVAATGAYCQSLAEIAVDDRESLLAELGDWTLSLDGPNPALLRLERAKDLALAALGAEQERLRREQEALLEGQRTLEAERARLLAGEETHPPLPHTREGTVREGRPGAPLWQLVDFAETLSPAERAGLEAALEAAGLLDGWLLPDGTLLAPETQDTLLDPDAPAAGAGLTSLLVPAVDRGDPAAGQVNDATLARVLAAIGAGPEEGPVWAAVDGRFGLGPAQGRWGKEEARYIGRGAREAARRRRLEAIAAELAQLMTSLDEVDARLQALAQRRARLAEEWNGRPDDLPLRAAHGEEAAAARARRDHERVVEDAARRLRAARERLAEEMRARDEAAADLQLPTEAAHLAALLVALAELRLEWRGLVAAARNHQERRQRQVELQQEAQALRETAARQALLHEEAERAAREAEVHRDTLRATVGAAVEAVTRRLAEVNARVSSLEGRLETLRRETTATATRIGELSSTLVSDEQRLTEFDDERRVAIERLRELAREGLVRVAVGEVEGPDPANPWNPDPAVRLARRLEQLLTEVDDGENAWNRNQKGLYHHFTTLAAALSRHGHEAHAEQADDLLLVRILFQSRPRAPDELATALTEEIAARRALLDNRERELIEKHLVSDVASHLQERISAAEQQVARMNRELESRPTSTGMRLRLAWQPLGESEEGAPAGLAEARSRLLRQVIDAWSKEEREAVGAFLKRRIDAARAAEANGSLVELLARALDYRHWHRFVVERFQDAKWRPAYGPASGGERALIITIPLFAAASSHYGSADPHAPRLVLLDEAFAGIDDDSRAKCMGLVAHFDLDIMMTSEREWGCYPDVPGLAICQLVRREGVDAVFVSRWWWDGHQRRRDEVALPPLEPPRPPSEAAWGGATGELF